MARASKGSHPVLAAEPSRFLEDPHRFIVLATCRQGKAQMGEREHRPRGVMCLTLGLDSRPTALDRCLKLAEPVIGAGNVGVHLGGRRNAKVARTGKGPLALPNAPDDVTISADGSSQPANRGRLEIAPLAGLRQGDCLYRLVTHAGHIEQPPAHLQQVDQDLGTLFLLVRHQASQGCLQLPACLRPPRHPHERLAAAGVEIREDIAPAQALRDLDGSLVVGNRIPCRQQLEDLIARRATETDGCLV